jgi:hypothetical protein
MVYCWFTHPGSLLAYYCIVTLLGALIVVLQQTWNRTVQSSTRLVTIIILHKIYVQLCSAIWCWFKDTKQVPVVMQLQVSIQMWQTLITTVGNNNVPEAYVLSKSSSDAAGHDIPHICGKWTFLPFPKLLPLFSTLKHMKWEQKFRTFVGSGSSPLLFPTVNRMGSVHNISLNFFLLHLNVIHPFTLKSFLYTLHVRHH